MILNLPQEKSYSCKLLQQAAAYKVNTEKRIALLSTDHRLTEKEIWGTTPFTLPSKMQSLLGTPEQEVKDL